MTANKGTLYGIGVGPGDPRLLTLWAVEILGRVPVIFAAGSTKNDYSLALDVVREHITGETQVRPMVFPMTHDPDSLNEAWAGNASAVLEVLNRGLDAAFITIGDPLTYSTFGYLLKTVRERDPDVGVVTVPGVTSYQAAAAKLNMPLAQGRESIVVIPGINNGDSIKALAGDADNVIILKAYRNFDRICDALNDMGLEENAVMISCCGQEGERIERDISGLRGEVPPYLSLLLVKKKGLS